ncbi:Glycoside hydrolase [Macleaya cordata]|uniref:endo-polygalacturonase n=1 Tax=Macleaya cordata TaxID=56857 RepID=A0A200RE35_MACCD|nr:Glycoside hydrolase [Macleaya cordata]
MGLQKQLLQLFMLLVSSFSCYSSLNQDPLSNYLDKTSAYDNSAYPTYFGTINDEDQDGDFEPNFNYEPDESSNFESFSEVGSPSSSIKVVNVNDFGAKGDGTDATEAFEKAWEEACSSTDGAVLLVPQSKKYLLRKITFSGPCKSELTMKVYGIIEASANRADYKKDTRHWILFQNIQNFKIEGGGTFDGKGDIWWKNSCKIDKSRALTFYNCKNLSVKNLRIRDAQQIHISIEQCFNVQALNLLITAPERSPNTDGIHVAGTRKIQIISCVIKTGDDCISIVSGSQNVQAMDITCGPGHGISIGSLGAGKSEAHVSDIFVDTAKLSGTTNGVRIKSWQGGSGNANKITFQNVYMHNVTNPIIIDQNYCDQTDPCNEQESAVQVKDVVYKNIRGTSASDVAVKFDCSKGYPCRGVVLQNINLVREGGNQAKALCKSVKLTKIGGVTPNCP